MAKAAGGKKGGGKAKSAGGKKGGKAAAKPAASGGDGRPLSAADNDAERALFINHRTAWNEWRAKLAVVEELEKDVKAALKNDGFTVKQMQIADQLAGNPKQEAKVRAEVEDRLRVAKWMGHPMGAQLDLFGQPDRTPSVDRAYDQGKQAAMEAATANPPYAPATPQAQSWLAGYHDEQAARLKRGIKPLEPKPEEPVAQGAGAGDDEPDFSEVGEESEGHQDGEQAELDHGGGADDPGDPPAGWGGTRMPPAAASETDL